MYQDHSKHTPALMVSAQAQDGRDLLWDVCYNTLLSTIKLDAKLFYDNFCFKFLKKNIQFTDKCMLQ